MSAQVRIEATNVTVSRGGDALNGASSCSGTLRMGCSSRGCSLGVFVVLGERNRLPSSDMGVLLSPLLRVRAGASSYPSTLCQAIRRAQGRSTKLSVSGRVRIPPPSLRAFLPRVRKSAVLASCGTDLTSLQNFGRRNSALAHDARAYLMLRQRSALT